MALAAFLKRSQNYIYSRVSNAAQSGSIAAFFTKRSYKSQPIRDKKCSYRGSKNAAIWSPQGAIVVEDRLRLKTQL